jgi:malic enzyme
VRTNQDMRDVYTPGVARVCTAIAGLTVEADQLVPDVLDRRVHEAVAEAVRQAAVDCGVAVRSETPAALELP